MFAYFRANGKRSAALGALVASTTVVSACGGSGTSQIGADGGGTLSVTTTIGGPEDYHNIPIDDFFTAVNEDSGGQIDFDFSYVDSIASPDEVGSAIGDGVVDAGLVVTSYNPAEYPVSNWLSQLAFAGESGPPAAALERSAAVGQWWKDNPAALESDFVSQGIIPLTPGINAHTQYHLLCTEPVTTLDEAQGRTVRTPGEAWADTADALGMEAVSLPGAELYESLQRGVVDCVMADAPDIISSDLHEVAQNFTTVNLPGFTPYGIFVSEHVWNSLDEELKDSIWDHLPVYVESLTAHGLELQDELLQTPEMEFHEVDGDFASALEEHQASVRASAAETAPEVIDDPEGTVDQFFAVHDEWAGTVTDEMGVADEESWDSWFEEGGSVEDIDLEEYTGLVSERVFDGRRPE